MKLSNIATLAGLNVLFGSAAASFFIYASQDTISGTGADLYYFFPGYPDCNDVNRARAYVGTDNVSGNRQGVVCEGSGCYNGNPADIDRFEFNIADGHFTIYKDRGFGMFDLGDGQIAACNPTREDDFICGAPFAATGVTVFFCNTVGF